MLIRLLPLVVGLALAVPAMAQDPGPAGGPPQSATLKQAIGHFEKAFYELMPKSRAAEAAAEFDEAVAGFEAETAASPASADPHRYLARIYAFRKEHKKAAAEWDKVVQLSPFDVDACVLAALAYIDAKDVPEARLRLVEGKARTLDADVLARLDEYIAKLDALKR